MNSLELDFQVTKRPAFKTAFTKTALIFYLPHSTFGRIEAKVSKLYRCNRDSFK